jgi:Uma2 family endonuclease
MIIIKPEDFLASLRKKRWAHELVNGEVVAVPRVAAGKRRARGCRPDVEFVLYEHYLQKHPVGKFLECSPFFMLSEMLPTLRRPDLAFISSHRLAEFDFDQPIVKTIPDLAIEFVTDPVQWRYKHERVRDFLLNGSAMAWVIDLTSEWVAVYQGKAQPQLFYGNDRLLGGSILPGLRLPVYELFE